MHMRFKKGFGVVKCHVVISAAGALSGVRKGSVDKLISEGNESYRKGNISAALQAYNQALQLDPENPEAWNNKGLILAVAGNYREALKCHMRAVELEPKHIDAISNIGMVHTKLENNEEAIAWYDRALKMDPSHETTWNNKGNLLSKLGKYDESLACYDRALEINPNYMAAMNNKAVELIHLKRYDEALDLLNAVLKSRPLFSEGWYVKGKAYVGMGEFEKAIICLERAHRLNPDFQQAKRALGILKSKLVQSPGAKPKEKAKGSVRAEAQRTKTERSIQNEILSPRAEADIMQAEIVNPEEHLTKEEGIAFRHITDEFQPSAVLKKAVGNALSKPALDRALEGLERKGFASSRASGKTREYAKSQSLGTIEQEMLEEKEEQEKESPTNDVHALVARARRYLENGRHRDAASNLRKALKINPYDDMAICLLAQAQFEMGERDRAINTISKILVRKPDFIPAWFTLANASLKAKEYVDSADCFRKILELQPGNAEATKGLKASEAALGS